MRVKPGRKCQERRKLLKRWYMRVVGYVPTDYATCPYVTVHWSLAEVFQRVHRYI